MNYTRWSPYRFKNGKTARNRVVVPPMASQTADTSGFATAATVKHYKNLGRSGAGIVFAEYSYIHQSGKGEPNQLGADSDEKIYGLHLVAQALQKKGALAGLQIVHVGGKGGTELTGGALLGPSAIPVPMKGAALETPQEMDLGQIKAMRSWYLAAAARAQQAGFDLVELHAAHGYGLNQWLSPLTNQREDAYGGNIAGRSLLLREIAAEIKFHFPELLLSIRLPAQDHFPQGLTAEEMAWVVSELELIGADLIDVSSGIGGWRRPRGVEGQGYLVGDAALLKQATSLPVIGVGGIQTGSFIDEILTQGKVDFAAVGRAILSAPYAWKKQQMVYEASAQENALCRGIAC